MMAHAAQMSIHTEPDWGTLPIKEWETIAFIAVIAVGCTSIFSAVLASLVFD